MAVTAVILGIACVFVGILRFRLHPFLVLIAAAIVVELANEASREAAGAPAAARVGQAFGDTAGRLALLIAMASLIGRCLLKSRAADRVVEKITAALGQRRAPVALMATSFVLGIPVFFDTVFYLLVPLAKALRLRHGGPYLLSLLAIVAGATMAHSLVPPTPGPLFVAESLRVPLGKMILVGMAIGLCTLPVGYAYARWIAYRMPIPLREAPDLAAAELEGGVGAAVREPAFLIALMPVLLPVLLIGGRTFTEAYGIDGAWLEAIGEKNTALVVSAVVAVAIYLWAVRPSAAEVGKDLNPALVGAAGIVMITAAGGAFGAALRGSGIGELFSQLVPATPMAILPAAFLITAAVRTAQGSATVAMITATGLLSPVLHQIPLPYDPVYVAVAIGCGSKPLSWMNDSGFWVICRMSGMTVPEALRAVTPMTALMGTVGLGTTMLAAWFVPHPLG